jgi:hypothetical protein
MNVEPRVPLKLSPLARACLEKLAEHGELVSVGGAVGLSYYLEYRPTADVDAWWEGGGTEQRAALIAEIESVLRLFGPVRRRSWGDVDSVELQNDDGTHFSFQVAARSARLHDPVAAPWPTGLRVDSLEDLVASKMEALVARGAPRDFRDIRTLCAAELSSAAELWELWTRRRRGARQEADRTQAALAVRTHLARIERVRPLETIESQDDRFAAAELRTWVKENLLGGLV